MYCVIQEMENRKYNEYGAYKELEVYSITMTDYSTRETNTSYGYRYAGDRFKRPIRKSFKISIHESYRENGKVKKKQWVICTMGYYEIAEGFTWVGDHTIKLSDKLEQIGITEDELCNLVYKKLDPLVKKIKQEFQQTEEYKIKKKHDEIIKTYIKKKAAFEKKYRSSTYDYCYDVFGNLMNEEMLSKVKANYKASKEYESRYYENFKSNYNNNSFGGYCNGNNNNYTEEEKKYLKIIYRAAAMKLHPDIKKDNGEGMQFLNKLKDQWGI